MSRPQTSPVATNGHILRYSSTDVQLSYSEVPTDRVTSQRDMVLQNVAENTMRNIYARREVLRKMEIKRQ